MKAPKSSQEINKKWVEYILRKHTAAPTPPALLRVDTCAVKEETGDGYNSQVAFFTVETTEKLESNSPETKKLYHLVAKFFSQDPQNQAFNKKAKTFLKEYLMYTELINAMNNMLNAKAPEEPKISLPKLIYGKCTSKEFVLVMENLQHTGYELNDKRKGLDNEQLKTAVDHIARVHAVSYALEKSKDMSKYSCFSSTLEYMKFFSIMMEAMLDNCIKFLTFSKETEELGNKIQLCKSVLLEKSTTSIQNNYTINCLVHGDYWNNNFMFKYAEDSDGQKVIEKMMIIDWGNASWGTPLFDLQYLVYTSTTRTIRKDHLDEVLSHYHQTFMRLTTILGYQPDNWSLEKFKTEWNTSYILGVLLGCALTQGTLSTNNPTNKKPEPSILDKPLFLPVKFVVDGMKVGAANLLMPLMLSPRGKKLFVNFMNKFMKPLLEELKSGKNEVMNTRLLELLHEADENGLFTT